MAYDVALLLEVKYWLCYSEGEKMLNNEPTFGFLKASDSYGILGGHRETPILWVLFPLINSLYYGDSKGYK